MTYVLVGKYAIVTWNFKVGLAADISLGPPSSLGDVFLPIFDALLDICSHKRTAFKKRLETNACSKGHFVCVRHTIVSVSAAHYIAGPVH
jgi:hypothetical protein